MSRDEVVAAYFGEGRGVNWVNAVIQGMLLGGQYALIACGLSLTFGVMRIVNLAHGDLAVCGAYLGLVLSSALGVPVWVTLPLLLPAAFGAGMALQVLLFGRALRHGVLAPVLVTFGLSVMIENLLQVAATSDPRGLNGGVAGAGQLPYRQRHHRVLAVPDRVPDRVRGAVRPAAAAVAHRVGPQGPRHRRRPGHRPAGGDTGAAGVRDRGGHRGRHRGPGRACSSAPSARSTR